MPYYLHKIIACSRLLSFCSKKEEKHSLFGETHTAMKCSMNAVIFLIFLSFECIFDRCDLKTVKQINDRTNLFWMMWNPRNHIVFIEFFHLWSIKIVKKRKVLLTSEDINCCSTSWLIIVRVKCIRSVITAITVPVIQICWLKLSQLIWEIFCPKCSWWTCCKKPKFFITELNWTLRNRSFYFAASRELRPGA